MAVVDSADRHGYRERAPRIPHREPHRKGCRRAPRFQFQRHKAKEKPADSLMNISTTLYSAVVIGVLVFPVTAFIQSLVSGTDPTSFTSVRNEADLIQRREPFEAPHTFPSGMTGSVQCAT
jgi:hypothetical protein